MNTSLLKSLCVFALVAFAARVDAAVKPVNGKLAFTSNRDGNPEIYIMNQNGSTQTRLTNDPAANDTAAWSPDGQKIAHSQGGNIFVMKADGSNPTQLTQLAATNGAPSWSPDGLFIAFHSNRDGNFEIYVMSANGSNQTRLTTNTADDFDPSWSPDGNRIVFRSLRDGNSEIYVMNRDGSGQTRLTNNPLDDQEPSFSPDGTKILFTGRVSGLRQLFLMNANGASPVQLTSNGSNFNGAISPDGRRIAFVSDRDGNFEVYTMTVDGNNPVRVTNNTAADTNPAWQPRFLQSTVGIYRPNTGQWVLRNTNLPGPAATITVTFGGLPGDLPVTGDWDGDGLTDLGIFRNGTFLLGVFHTTTPCAGCAPITVVETQPEFTFGQAGDRPIAGDWDGDAVDEVGVFRTTNIGGTFLLRKTTKTTIRPCGFCNPITITTVATESHDFGGPGDLPVTGDWDGDGKDTIGVFHPAAVGSFTMTDDFVEPNILFPFGTVGDLPLSGDWTATKLDRVGVFRPSTATMMLATQLFADPDLNFVFGTAGDLPVSGRWSAAQ